MRFDNRSEAGKKLARELLKYKFEKPVILALPRGGVPVGFEVAKVLQAPLNVIVARKIGAPSNREFGIGAISEGGVRMLDEDNLNRMALSKEEIEEIIDLEEKDLEGMIAKFRKGKNLPSLKGKVAILVDDGLATGVTASAAALAVKKLKPKKIVFAAPVCASDSVEKLQAMVDRVICLKKPFMFTSVGLWYKDFKQVSDEEVVELLKKAKNVLTEY